MTTNRFHGGPRLTRKAFLRSSAAAAGVAALGGLGLGGLAAPARAAGLITRPIPSSGEQIPIVGLGTARVFDVPEGDSKLPTLKATVDTFVKGGGKVIDCSPTYGRAEAVVGHFIHELGYRDRVFYATKISTEGEANGIRQVEQALKEWHTDRFDLLQVHNIRDYETQIRTIRRLKDEGKVRYIGVTTSFPRDYDRYVELLKREKLDTMQINYSVEQPASEERVLAAAKDIGIAVIINRPFALAATFRKVRGKPLPEWAGELGIKSWAQYFLKFVLSHPAVTCAIPGTDTPEYMVDNLGAATGPMPDAAMRDRMLAHYKSL